VKRERDFQGVFNWPATGAVYAALIGKSRVKKNRNARMGNGNEEASPLQL
jgi:hypothetical protein